MVEEVERSSPENEQEEKETHKPEGEPLEELIEDELASSQELEEKNKKLFARAKKAEEKAKRLEAELFAYQKQKEKEKEPSVSPDIVDLTKKISVLKDFSPEELDYISLISKAKRIPMEEAVKTDEVSLYIQARREKVAKESKVPEPSTKQIPSTKDYSEWTTEDIKNASMEELEKYRAWMKQQRRPIR